MDEATQIALVEVGPRDGLQSEDTLVSTQSKADFISCLMDKFKTACSSVVIL